MRQSADVIKTSRSTKRRQTRLPALLLEPGSADGSIEILPQRRRQTILGFGGAFTESAAWTWSCLPPRARARVLRSCFHRDGLGYTLGRLAIGSSDFAREPYTYVAEDDRDLRTFTIEHERRWVVPFVKAAAAEAGKMPDLVASPWSPPAWMKSNGRRSGGGRLLEEMRPAWARHYIRFVAAMREAGVPVRALTVQNEPEALQRWESCLYTPEEERDFVRDHLGPELHRSVMGDLRLLVWDHNRDHMVERADTVLADPRAAPFVWGVANHWYISEEFENLSRVHDRHPSTHLLFTEGCVEGGVQADDWPVAERYARNMIGDFRNWQEGWIDWNLLLDGTGGPNHAGNFCHAPIIADGGDAAENAAWHAIGHFSRFVRPGAVNVETASPGEALPHVAFENPDGSAVLVVQNATDDDRPVSFSCRGRGARFDMECHSIATFVLPS